MRAPSEHTTELWFVAPRTVELRSRPLLPQEADVLVRGICSAISRGTELTLFKGEFEPPFDEAMGASNFPCRYGYSWIGRRTDNGKRVFALLPHATAHCVQPSLLREIPDGIDDARATLAANMETAVTAVWDANLSPGERVTVFGGGIVGLLCAWIASREGAEVALVEPQESRAALGRALGIEQNRAFTGGNVAIEVTGNPEVLSDAIHSVGMDGRVVVASFYGNRRASIDLGGHFHRNRIALQSTQVSTIPLSHRAEWTFDRRFALVLDLLSDHALNVLTPERFAFERTADVYRNLETGISTSPFTVFDYSA